jgi:hypothetical protein
VSQPRFYITEHSLPIALHEDLDDLARGECCLAAARQLLAAHGWTPIDHAYVEVSFQRLDGADWVTCEQQDADVARIRIAWTIATTDGKRGAWGEAWA